MKMNAICYRTTEGNEFLAYYTYKNDVDAKAEADELNTSKPATLWNGEPAHCDIRTYYAAEVEEM